MAPDARRHPRGVDVEASALSQGPHERVRDLGLALSAEAARVWVVVLVRRRRRRRRIASAAACCCSATTAADCVAAVWSDQHGSASFSFVELLREKVCGTLPGLYCSIFVEASKGEGGGGEEAACVCEEKNKERRATPAMFSVLENMIFVALCRSTSSFFFFRTCFSRTKKTLPPLLPPPPLLQSRSENPYVVYFLFSLYK